MKKTFLASALFAMPFLVSAADLTTVVEKIGDLIAAITPIIVALALVYFFWGLAKYILASGEGKDEGKSMMIWGIIALFVMVSVWGLVGLIGNTFSVGQGGDISNSIPKVQL